jgi:hypothetical protein
LSIGIVVRLAIMSANKISKGRLNCICFYLLVTAFVVKSSDFLATDPEVRVRFPALPNFLGSSGARTGSTQSQEYN